MTKHDSKTADELILENAPEGATHVEIESSGDFEYWRLKGGLFEWHHFCPTSQDYIYSFQKVDSESMEDYHSLTDIKELVELRKKNAELNTAYETVTQTRCVSYEDLAIRDLEQQAKICEFLAETTYTDTAHGITEQFRLYQTARDLREQAKQLKEQSSDWFK